MPLSVCQLLQWRAWWLCNTNTVVQRKHREYFVHNFMTIDQSLVCCDSGHDHAVPVVPKHRKSSICVCIDLYFFEMMGCDHTTKQAAQALVCVVSKRAYCCLFTINYPTISIRTSHCVLRVFIYAQNCKKCV